MIVRATASDGGYHFNARVALTTSNPPSPRRKRCNSGAARPLAIRRTRSAASTAAPCDTAGLASNRPDVAVACAPGRTARTETGFAIRVPEKPPLLAYGGGGATVKHDLVRLGNPDT